jgi:inositol-pentakisphosphate 2-kinase
MMVKTGDIDVKSSIAGGTSRKMSNAGDLEALDEGSVATKTSVGHGQGATPDVSEMGQLSDQLDEVATPVNEAPSQTVHEVPDKVATVDPSSNSHVSDWHYVAEGGANVVFGYHGSSPSYRNRALRIPKSRHYGSDDVAAVSELSVLWRDELLPRLLPKAFLPDVKPVGLNGNWVADLLHDLGGSRPDFRSEIDLSAFRNSEEQVHATLMDDLRTSSSDVSHAVLAIEIKVGKSTSAELLS